MNRPLARSALFSMGVHGLVLLPMGFLPATNGEPAADVVRGASSVELELVAPLPEEGEGISSPQTMPEPSPRVFLDEGVTADWNAVGRRNDPPRYPWVARANGWEGTVRVRVRVGSDGRVVQWVVHQSSGHAILDQAALKAIQGWTFQPAQRDGKAESSWVEIPVSFRLQTGQRK